MSFVPLFEIIVNREDPKSPKLEIIVNEDEIVFKRDISNEEADKLVKAGAEEV